MCDFNYATNDKNMLFDENFRRENVGGGLETGDRKLKRLTTRVNLGGVRLNCDNKQYGCQTSV